MAVDVPTAPLQVVWRSFSLLSHPSLVAQWLEHLHGKRKVLGSIPGLGKHFSPEYDCSLHQEQSLKSSWMIGEDLRRNTLAWYSCPDRCINARLRPEDHQLRLENFYAPYFQQMGHWNSVKVIKVIKSIFPLPSAPASLFSILLIWEWFHEMGLAFLIKKHPLHFEFSNSNPEKFEFKLGNWKWENDYLGPKIPTFKKLCLWFSQVWRLEMPNMKLLKDILSNGPYLVSCP